MSGTSHFALTQKFYANEALSTCDIVHAITASNQYLKELSSVFNMDSVSFYTTLNQRNLSGFVGEVFKHSLCSSTDRYAPNPHPDGRPDLLDLETTSSRDFFKDKCFSAEGAPQRIHLAPYPFGGIEVKSCIGSLKNATDYPIGIPRHMEITTLNYWAHHAHECQLLGLYYDFCSLVDGNPQIKAAFFCKLEASDWNKVSIGDPNKKKTSNTSLNASGTAKVRNNMICHSTEPKYIDTLSRLGCL